MIDFADVPILKLAAPGKWSLNGGPFGSKLVSSMYTPNGIPVIRGANLPLGQRFHDADFVFVSEVKAEELRAHTAAPGDVIFTQRGTLGQVGIIPASARYPLYVISQSQMKLTVNPALADPTYVYYAFRAPEIVGRFIAMASTSGVPHVNLQTLRDFCIPVPPFEIQRRIASILGAYDDLIEVNRRRVAILEEMARGLFEEWFVRFRFPGHERVPMVETAEGLLPDGWRYGQLGALIRLHYGKALKADGRRPGKVSVIGSSGVVGEHDVALVSAPGIVVGRKGNVGSVIWSHHDFWPIDTTYYVQTTTPLAFAYELLRRVPFQNTDAAVPGLNRDYALSRMVVIPATETVEKFGIFAQPLRDQVERLTTVNRALEASRDLLLPRLISGQLSVEAAERELEAAA